MVQTRLLTTCLGQLPLTFAMIGFSWIYPSEMRSELVRMMMDWTIQESSLAHNQHVSVSIVCAATGPRYFHFTTCLHCLKSFSSSLDSRLSLLLKIQEINEICRIMGFNVDQKHLLLASLVIKTMFVKLYSIIVSALMYRISMYYYFKSDYKQLFVS